MLILKLQRKMPESCIRCPFYDEVYGWCLATVGTDGCFHIFDFDIESQIQREDEERDPRCPLMEVPDDACN